MRWAKSVLIGLLLALLAPAAPAWAHTQLLTADPAKGAVLAAAPATVTLRFSQRLNPDYTTIVVSDTARQPIPAAAPVIAGDAGTITLGRPLGNGAYTVAYRVVSTDGHTVQGSYPFTVADPSLPAAIAPASAVPFAATPAAGGFNPFLLLIPLAAVLIAAMIWYGRSWRSRRES
ncbi:copper resistance CopC family protein [Actinoplanes sp. L3-i22]|uniref:copper resistance CopC family protein n=1 Tax=Actinoplanes sp. L3-i22 TaxID=2836373 RepID=UPI001C76D58F|nr:copper resistance CopC family protein [Actinoplanes sp. L3-i22]BCY11235.1 hypothetical protein L3i22_063230 [Actinoplanes sp. L3-i22]